MDTEISIGRFASPGDLAYLRMIKDLFDRGRDALIRSWLKQDCDECSETPTWDDGLHGLIRVGATVWVAIGCEGYHHINPNAVDGSCPGWMDWTIPWDEQ
jgi:hypothetical protein